METTKKSVLVVEDDILMANVVANKLKLTGFDALIVGDGQAAVENISKQKFDLILLDLTMPWFDGFHVLEDMKKNNINTPVIIMSNLAGQEDVEKAKALGAVNYLVKTNVTPDEIVKEIQRSIK